MRKWLYILLMMPCAAICAQSSVSDLYKQWMIEDINRGQFDKAVEEIRNVEEWNGNHIYRLGDWFDINQVLQFIHYMDSIDMGKALTDSVRLYLAIRNDNTYASYLYSQDYYEQTIPSLKFSSSVYQSVLGKAHPYYINSLNSIGITYRKLGDYEKAESYLLETLNLYKTIMGEHHPNYIRTLDNLGGLYRNMDDYQKAEHYLLKALNLRKAFLGEAHPDYAISLNNVGGLYDTMGDYEKAEHYSLEALALRKAVLGEHHPDYISTLDNLGVTAYKKGNYDKAKTMFLEALRLQKISGNDHSLAYAILLEHCGSTLDKKKDYEQSEKYHFEALEILKNLIGEHHPEYVSVINNIGGHYYFKGEYEKAERYLSEALVLRKAISGEQALEYANSVNNVGQLFTRIGEYSKAESYIHRSVPLYKQWFMHSLAYMSERQRQYFWNTLQWSFTVFYPIYFYRYYAQEKSVVGFAYDNELFVKGLLLTSSNVIRNSILTSSDTVLIQRWNEMRGKKQRLMALEENGGNVSMVEQLRSEVELLEKDITIGSAIYRENQRQWQITWDSVRHVLKPNQVAIEYMVAPLSDDSTIYCALLLRDTCTYPIMIPLFEEKEVTGLLHKTIDDTATINSIYKYHRNGKQLSELIWTKVKPYLNKDENIFFSAIGVLHKIAIENLPYDSTHTMGDIYNLVRLSSTRELALKEEHIIHNTATLYGDIRYGTTPEKMYAYSRKYRDILRDGAQDLPGTKLELEAIAPILKNQNIKVQTFTADTANEESFKALSGTKQNILHIGTHGFYWSDTTAQQQQFFTQKQMLTNERPENQLIDPLYRCGLLFAGANTALAGDAHRLEEGVDDGILTAKEISLMDLRGTDIVVLSACETGLGDITGDGVFGLQRGFKMAGAQTILMSLWKVHDDATRLLMTSFYRHYANGLSKREAFRKAQQEVRNYTGTTTSESKDRFSPSQDKFLNKINHSSGSTSHSDKDIQPTTDKSNTHPYADPYYWAGFIMLD